LFHRHVFFVLQGPKKGFLEIPFDKGKQKQIKTNKSKDKIYCQGLSAKKLAKYGCI
jgi:hypothetical protein